MRGRGGGREGGRMRDGTTMTKPKVSTIGITNATILAPVICGLTKELVERREGGGAIIRGGGRRGR